VSTGPNAATTRTACPYCGVGCGLRVSTANGRLRSVEGDPDHPVNRGRTCRKPLELPAAMHAPDRADRVLYRERRQARLLPSSYDEVMPVLGARLRSIVDRHGPDAVAFYLSGQLLTEDYYAAVKLAKGFLGTNNVDSNSRLCMASAVAGYTGAFGSDGPPASYADLEDARCILLLGTNTAACHPIIWARIQDAQREGTFVACADPRATQTAQGSDLHLPVLPGTDLALLNAMLVVVEAEGLIDRDFVDRHTSGLDEALAIAREWTPERAAEVCGVSREDIEALARRFAAGPSMVLWSMGANQSTVGTLKNRAMINLCLATGQIGRPGTGPFSITGQPNAMGGREVGGAAQTLPGYRLVESAGDRSAMERLWGLDPDGPGIAPEPGLTAVDLFRGIEEGRVKAVWIAGTNPVVSMPDGVQARAALEAAELVVVQDAYHPTETSALAHAVLPAAGWLEKDGVMTNSERRVTLARRALDPPGEALPDWRIFARLASELGFGDAFAWPDAAAVYDEVAATTAGRVCDQSGLSHEVLDREGSAQWPRPAGTHAPDPRHLYPDHRYPTADGRALFAATPHAPPAESVDDEYPLLLTTGRVANQWHTMTRTGKSEALVRSEPEPFVEVSPDDAERAGLADGEAATLVSRRGQARLTVRLDSTIPRGVCFAPMHWGGLHAPPGAGHVGATTNSAYDPTSRQPELKAAAVRLEPAGSGERPVSAGERNHAARARRAARRGAARNGSNGGQGRRRRLIVVGTGMAGLRTAEEVVERSPTDWRVTMLGEEPGLAYNRILLSKVLARTAGFEDVELRPSAWYEAARVDLRGGAPATELDLARRAVLDARGATHPYDALVLATGSRPFVPPVPGAERPHVHVFRTTEDAVQIASAADVARRAVVVGGGLLGLEAAAGLMEHGVEVTAVEMGERLMPRQLDAAGARMLEARLCELGLDLRLDDRVEEVAERHVTLAGGEELEAEIVVMAAGVRPELSLAEAAGIETDRGIVVDDEMRTSAESVFAVGECAEHRGVVHGLWAPLAEQARAAGAAAVGDPAGLPVASSATTLKIAGVDLFAGGVQSAAEGQHELVWSDPRASVYRKLVVEGDRLVGAIAVGDPAGARRLTELLRTGEDVPEVLTEPPGSASDDEEADDEERIVCSCNRRTHGEILSAVRSEDLRTLAEVAKATAATTGCGSCTGEVEDILAGFSSDTEDRSGAREFETAGGVE